MKNLIDRMFDDPLVAMILLSIVFGGISMVIVSLQGVLGCVAK